MENITIFILITSIVIGFQITKEIFLINKKSSFKKNNLMLKKGKQNKLSLTINEKEQFYI